MSPELLKLSNGIEIGIFDAEKCDIFSLGLTFLRLLLNLKESSISGLNAMKIQKNYNKKLNN